MKLRKALFFIVLSAEMGIFHPDDMSGIILTSFHRDLNGKEIKLEEQIKYYKDYWKKNK